MVKGTFKKNIRLKEIHIHTVLQALSEFGKTHNNPRIAVYLATGLKLVLMYLFCLVDKESYLEYSVRKNWCFTCQFGHAR